MVGLKVQAEGCNACEPYANRALIAETHAKMGWVGMQWDTREGGAIAVIADIAEIGKQKPNPTADYADDTDRN